MYVYVVLTIFKHSLRKIKALRTGKIKVLLTPDQIKVFIKRSGAFLVHPSSVLLRVDRLGEPLWLGDGNLVDNGVDLEAD